MEIKGFSVNHIGVDWAGAVFPTLIGLIVFICLTGEGCLYLFLRGHIIATSRRKLFGKVFDAVFFHTYKPKRLAGAVTVIGWYGDIKIPNRGITVAKNALSLAELFHCPIMITSGQTMKWAYTTESEFYKQLVKVHDSDVEVILGFDKGVRDTSGEVIEAERICEKKGFRSIIVVGSWPHMVRISNYWRPIIDKGKIKINFVGVHIPLRFYLWELVAWLFDGIIFGKILPRRYRELALNIIGRHGP